MSTRPRWILVLGVVLSVAALWTWTARCSDDRKAPGAGGTDGEPSISRVEGPQLAGLLPSGKPGPAPVARTEPSQETDARAPLPWEVGVTVLVLDAADRPVDGALVYTLGAVRDVDIAFEAFARTDAGGVARYFRPHLGSLRFRAERDGLSGTSGPALSGDTVRIILAPTLVQRVLVTGGEGAAVPGAYVTAASTVGEEGDIVFQRVTTDDEGRATLKLSAPGRYALTAWAPGHSFETISVRISGDSPARDVELQLKPRGTLRFRAATQAGDLPESVRVTTLGIAFGPASRTLDRGASDCFSLPSPGDGATLLVEAPHFGIACVAVEAGRIYGGTASDGCDVVVLQEGALVAGRVVGVAEGTDAVRVELAQVHEARPRSHELTCATALAHRSDSFHFRFSGLVPDTQFLLRVDAPSGRAHRLVSGRTGLAGSATETDVVLVEASRLVIDVTGPLGQPLAGALVARSAVGPVSPEAAALSADQVEPLDVYRTDAAGRVTLSAAPDVTHRVDVRATGHAPRERMQPLWPPAGTSRQIVVALSEMLILQGRVLDADGVPVPRARVDARRAPADIPGADPETLTETWSDEAGRFTLTLSSFYADFTVRAKAGASRGELRWLSGDRRELTIRVGVK